MNMQLKTILSIVLFVVLSAPQAMQTAVAQGADELKLEQIIVTGRKRDESLVDAPYAITALTAEDIEIRAIAEIDDIASFSPGFFNANFSVGRANREHRFLLFRGVHPRTELPHRAAASLFIDGAASIGPEFGAIQDVERIEVLRGPQAAYFGRSTYSGAINVITKDPGDEFSARVSADVAGYGTTRIAGSVDIPFGETFGARVSASTYETDGMYDNAAVSGQKLGARSTDDVSLTLKWAPSDSFDVKMRYHKWEDDDGPDATTLFDHRMGSGGEHHNCGLGSTWERTPDMLTLADLGTLGYAGDVTMAPSWICGEVPIPTAAQIGQDTGSARALALRNNARTDVALLPESVLPDQFGLAREAQEISFVANLDFDNGMNLSFIGAAHEDYYGSFNDFDQRATEGLYLQGLGGSMFGTFGSNHPADAQNARISNLEDQSWELRLSSSQDQRVRWMVGYSDTQIDTARQSFGSLIVTFPPDGIDNAVAPYPTTFNPYWFFTPGATATASNWNLDGSRGRVAINDGVDWADINTTAIFGSLSFDLNDQWTASLELRYQDDEVAEGNYAYERSAIDPVDGSSFASIPATIDPGLSDSFTSTLPRFIIDYKPFDNATVYASYSEGTRPGLFNTALAGLSPTELAQVLPQNNGSGLAVAEEEMRSSEIGLKTGFMDGRGFVAVTMYKSEIDNLHTSTFAAAYTDDSGAAQTVTGSLVSDSGSVEMSGIEVEGSFLISDKWRAAFTYSQNNSEFGNDFFSTQAYDLLGDLSLAAGNAFSRVPANSGSLSLDYQTTLSTDWDMYARGDVIYTGKQYASQANITHTGTSTRLNLRLGFASDRLSAEVYCLNCLDDDTPKGLQAMFDFSGISGGFGDVPAGIGNARALGVALADKPLVGVRASYTFGSSSD